MPQRLLSLAILVPILMVDAIIELSFISNMVAFLHGRGSKGWEVSYPAGETFQLHGHPARLLVDQGHTSNGAAGTAFVLIGCGGLLAMWLQHRRTRATGFPRPSPIFTFWVIMTILSMLLALAALIYTFVLTYEHNDQIIDLALAAAHPFPQSYPVDEWTPENWYSAILSQLPLALDSDRRKIRQQLRLMRGWRWNLIPLFVLGLITACAAVHEWLSLRREGTRDKRTSKESAARESF